MPLGGVKNGRSETTLVIDSFIALEKGREPTATAYAIWSHVDLDESERDLLERCCSLIGHLGRAESWCSVGVADAIPDDHGLQAVDLASRATNDGPTVRRLAVGPSLRGDGLLRSLSEPTGEMRKLRRLMPVGAAWVEYLLPADFLMVREQHERRERTHAVFGPTLLRFALDRGVRTPKPSIKDAVVFAELLRAATIKRLSDKHGEPATYRLAGKSAQGSPNEGHGHPYFLPFDGEGRGEIDGVDVWFPQGCTHWEYMAVTSVPELREHVVYEDNFPLTFIGRIAPPRASRWKSATPVVLDRFPKLRGGGRSQRVVDAPADQITAMAQRVTGHTTSVELWPPGSGIERRHGGHLRIDAFRRTRVRKAMPPLPVSAATLQFDEPVEGPIVLGRLAHFGLGRFEPIV